MDWRASGRCSGLFLAMTIDSAFHAPVSLHIKHRHILLHSFALRTTLTFSGILGERAARARFIISESFHGLVY